MMTFLLLDPIHQIFGPFSLAKHRKSPCFFPNKQNLAQNDRKTYFDNLEYGPRLGYDPRLSSIFPKSTFLKSTLVEENIGNLEYAMR